MSWSKALSVWLGSAVLLLACSEDTKPAATASDALVSGDALPPDVAGSDSLGDAVVKLPGAPTDVHIDILPVGQTKMTPVQRQAAMQKLKAGGEFVDLHMRPEVVPVLQKASDQVVVAPDQLSFPKAGNEALLALKPGAPLVGNRSATNGQNPFGFLRKVKSVKEVAGQIVVETEPARLQDVMMGSASLKIAADDLEILDTSGVDEGLYFPTWEGQFVPQTPKQRERRRWGRWRAPLKDLDADITYTSEWSAKASIKALSLNETTSFGGVSVGLAGELDLDASFSFKPSFYLQVGIDGLDLEYLNFGASGQLDLAGAMDLALQLELGVGAGTKEAASALSSLGSKPMKPEKKQVELLELGPFVGPTIPTTPPIPTTFKIDFVADCSLTAYGKINTHLEGGVSTGAGFGVSWEEADSCSSSADCWTGCNNGKCGPGGSGWDLTSSSNFSYWKNVSLELGGGVVAECGIQPQVQWLIGSIAGPMVGLRGAVRGTLDASSECPSADTISADQRPDLGVSLAFDVIASVLVGGKIDLWFTELGFEVTVYEYTWNVWKNTWNWVQEGFGWCEAACSDGGKNFAETDVDCGGTCAAKCAQGKGCQVATDCVTANCDGYVCGPNLCSDGKKDGTETDVDCGGACLANCAVGKGCATHADCDLSGATQLGCAPYGITGVAAQTCQVPSCSDGWQGPSEQVGIDCGGTCSCQPMAACTTDSGCAAGKACAGGVCVNSVDKACYLALNGKVDSGESAVDCGGACAGKVTDPNICNSKGVCAGKLFLCADTAACGVDGDCASGFCSAGKCAQHCADTKKDADETDVDCGGKGCAPCAQSKACLANTDCASGLFCSSLTMTCMPSTCTSAKKDGDETDVDCGGSCPAKCATGKVCKTAVDCASEICSTSLKCVASLCENGALDRILPDLVKYPKAQYFHNTPGYESSVDCGTTCAPCADGKACFTADNPLYIGDSGCAGGYCKPDSAGSATGKCATFSCKDGVKNGNEYDVDCGGTSTCPACGLDKACSSTSACLAGLICYSADGYNKKCKASGSGNGVKDLSETDIDCGGDVSYNPARCPVGKACQVASDCEAGLCSVTGKVGVCIASSCPNGAQDGNEGDVDCGVADVKLSPTCSAKCADGKKCSKDSHCSSGYCSVNGLCAANHCVDGKKDAGESFVDCGGPDCAACNLATGAACVKNEDCVSSVCEQVSSGSPMLCGASCKDGVQNGLESDVDCGTADCGKCADGKYCVSDSNCLSVACSKSGFCVASKCYNGKWDSSVSGGTNETDTDCGGSNCAACAAGKVCKVASDCVTGVCTSGKCALATSCSNGVQDGSESAVDCGSTCTKCALNKACKLNSDCSSNNCVGSKCLAAVSACSNGLVDGNETDFDCGGSCASKCALTKKCSVNADCQSAICDQSTVPPRCSSDACKDLLKSTATGETDVDCGGPCGSKCAKGKGCKANSDCSSSICSAGGKCVDSTCDDGVQSGDETGKDCGGSCKSKCKTGSGCLSVADCDGLTGKVFCSAGNICVTSTCSDGYLSSGEGDIDCGGVCVSKCPLGKKCAAGSDCASSFCDGAACVASACEDKVKSGNESDTDCGGTCAQKCATGKTCAAAGDCASGDCGADKTCQSGLCTSGQKDGDETDVDCGGNCQAKCLTGKGCAAGKDCASAVCAASSKVCVADTCGDEAKSPGESDVDCGLGCGKGCGVGKLCSANGDCGSGVCSAAGVCAADTCGDGKLTLGETDVDCGGPCASKCATGKGCVSGGDCAGGICSVGGQCVASLCEDGKKSGGETGVDCGGGCSGKCKTGEPCGGAGDCQSNLCAVTNLCVASNCQDGVVSGGESDVDCGGSCAQKCGANAKCKVEGDCASAACSIGGQCVASKCLDGFKNGDEADLDCGGSCPSACATGKACKAGSDCQAGVCSAASLCVATTCLDGKLSGDETALDCGGSCTAKCQVSAACKIAGDCQSGQCSVGGKCVATACENGVQDGGESAVDCGGTCGKCATGLACASGGDCQTGLCAATSKLCVASTCKDEAKSGDESDLDCGGSCTQKCLGGKVCSKPSDCTSGQCGAGNLCVASACDNGSKDAGEADIDCGGACPACAVGKTCSAGADCASSVCSVAKQCVANTCADGLKTLGEGDVDCGGACTAKCALAKGCASGGDCQSGICGASKLCVASLCVDGLKDGGESDVDCGGPCTANCALSKACGGDADCASAVCAATSLLCVSSTCSDQTISGTESDIDCGGSCATKCQSGKKCKITSDCAAGVCNALGVCAADLCNDGVKDGTETDIDCGGSCTQDCATGKACKVGGDCATAACSVGGLCVASACFDGTKNGSETASDCGGSCAANCAKGQGCATGTDCNSGYCSATTKLCVADACSDAVKDGTETDVDCAGSCAQKCALYSKCKANSDCDSGNCSPAGQCVTTCWSEPFSSAPATSRWKVYGSAAYDATNKWLQLTSTAANQSGKVFDVADYLKAGNASFSFKFYTGGGIGGGADGMALSIVSAADVAALDSYIAATKVGGCLGYGVTGGSCGTGVVKALHIELDTYNNTGNPFSDPTAANHVAIALNGDPANHVAWVTPAVNFEDAAWHTVAVTIAASTITVKLDGAQILSKTINGWTFAGGFMGFSASTGAATNFHRIDDVSVSQNCSSLGGPCSAGSDCPSGICSSVSKICVATSCEDQKVSGTESDVDCGGSCTANCANGKQCGAGGDCSSGVCSASGVCVATTCTDGFKNGSETATDCGGSCAKCATGKACAAGSDCSSGICSADSNKCVATTCEDEVKNGTETAKDCGGSCSKCALYKNCLVNSDCSSGSCTPAKKCGDLCWAVEDFANGLDPDRWKYYGDASRSTDGYTELTGIAKQKSGKLFAIADYLKAGVDTTISFKYYAGGGSYGGGDGMALSIVAAANLSALESYVAATKSGGCLGYGIKGGSCGSGTVSGLHVELDSYYNSGDPFKDPSANNHVAIALDGNPSVAVASADSALLEDGKWHAMVVQIAGNVVKVYIDGALVLSKAVSGFTFQGGFVGFTASTGDATNSHRIDDVQVKQGVCP